MPLDLRFTLECSPPFGSLSRSYGGPGDQEDNILPTTSAQRNVSQATCLASWRKSRIYPT